jgi:hypothetical protein
MQPTQQQEETIGSSEEILNLGTGTTMPDLLYKTREYNSDRLFETKLNTILSTIINEKLGIQSISEKRQGKGRVDILIFSGGIKIIIEASYSRQDAEHDVSKRVEDGFADIGIALHYLEKIPEVNDSEIKTKLERLKFEAKLFLPYDIRNTLDY